MKISVIVPILNEKNLVVDSLSSIRESLQQLNKEQVGNWEVVVSDAGSTDGSAELIHDFCSRNMWTAVLGKLSDPSVGRTVKQGIENSSGDLILILPIDTILPPSGFIELWKAAIVNNEICGGFKKYYKPSTLLLKLYQFIQNSLRSKVLKHVVWTNGIFFPKSLLQEIEFPAMGFLEDVFLSDVLRKKHYWTMLRGPLSVSSRRYNSGGTVRRILINIAIMSSFRLKLVGPAKLKTFYRG